ncbi:outer membrane protein assembly factor [Noviherbaspirillum aridicola]|uniref:Outer membrane protein assembly factor n=1 Tax=Noviherbaspirillum aridicola TaxID=2849687 RepID=A0ABQ4PZA7_9BURK|nr:outer membrane protein assembly factor [Noviherbaspirillum aridicola]
MRGPALMRACLCALALSSAWLPAAAESYRVELDASPELRRLLTEFLDLMRYRERDDINADQLSFMVATAPEQVEQLASTEGYFTPRTDIRLEQEDGLPLVRITVDAGPRTRVSTARVDVAGAAPRQHPAQVQELRDEWPLSAGEPFRQEAWNAAKQQGLQILQRRRYPAARIAGSEARILADSQQAELAVQYDSGPVFRLGEIEVSGTDRYPETIVRNVSPLRKGEEYRAERLLEFQRQVLRTPYYSNAVIDIDADPENAEAAPVRVRVTEFPQQRIRTGIGYTTDTGVHFDGLYSHNNMFGRAWVLDAQARLEQRRQFGRLELSLPPEPGAWVHSAFGSVERTTLEGIELESRRIGVRRARSTESRDTAWSLEYYNDALRQIDDADLPADVLVRPGTHQALVAGYARTRRYVDNPLFPRDGRIITLQAGAALKGLLTDQSFVRLYGRLREFIPVGKRDLVILRAEAGAVITEGGNASIPASLLFRAGGTDSVRGYGYQSIGNRVGNTVYPVRYLATGGAEYVHWLNEQWGGAVFYDLGVATDRWQDRSVFHAVGIGARYRSPVGRINVDLAYGFQKNRLRPHLSLGVAF